MESTMDAKLLAVLELVRRTIVNVHPDDIKLIDQMKQRKVKGKKRWSKS